MGYILVDTVNLKGLEVSSDSASSAVHTDEGFVQRNSVKLHIQSIADEKAPRLNVFETKEDVIEFLNQPEPETPEDEAAEAIEETVEKTE